MPVSTCRFVVWLPLLYLLLLSLLLRATYPFLVLFCLPCTLSIYGVRSCFGRTRVILNAMASKCVKHVLPMNSVGPHLGSMTATNFLSTPLLLDNFSSRALR